MTLFMPRCRLVLIVLVIGDLEFEFVAVMSGFVCPKLFIVLVDRIPVDLFARAKR